MSHARIAFLAATIFFGFTSSAQAICYFPATANAPTTGNHYIYTPIKKYTALYNDPHLVEIGKSFGSIQMLMQSNASYPSLPGRFFCGGGSNTLQMIGMGTPINQNIYPSNLPGIGYRINVHNAPYPNNTDLSTTTYPLIRTNSDSYSRFNRFEVKIDLIRTGQISCTGPFVGTFAQDVMDGQILGEFRFQ